MYMKEYPSASGRTLWIKDTEAAGIDAVTSYALSTVRRSRTVQLTDRHTDNGRVVWYQFKVQKVRS